MTREPARQVQAILRCLAPVGVAVALIVLPTTGNMLLGSVALLLVLLVEALVAEFRGSAGPGQVAWIACWSLLPWGLLGVFFSGVVPFAAWLFAIVVLYGGRALGGAQTADRPVALAWRQASDTFRRRRLALGRHYRWRVALAALPHFIYVFALSFLLLGVGVGLLGTVGMAAGSPETAAIGALFSMLFTALAVLVALPAAFGVIGLLLAPFLRGPFASLLRALLFPEVERPPRALGCAAGVVVLTLDLWLHTLGFVWAGVTFIGSAFPMGGSLGSVTLLLPLLLSLGLRLLLADALVLEADHPLRGMARLAKAAAADPLSYLELALWQLTVVGGALGLPLLALAGLSVGLLLRDAPSWWIGVLGFGGLLLWARLSAATVLRLALHRLMLLQSRAGASTSGSVSPGDLGRQDGQRPREASRSKK